VRADDRDPRRCVVTSCDLGRRAFLGWAVAATGAALLPETALAAAGSADVRMLQTAAALENLAVAVYTQVAAMSPERSGTSIPVVRGFVTATIAHHRVHAQAFNAAALALGGAAQTGIDRTVNDSVVTPALRRIAGPGDVLRLAVTLEDMAAGTYIDFGAAATDPRALRALATVAPVEAQHAAVLRAVGSLVGAGLGELVVVGPDLSKLPAAVGAAGFPDGFFGTVSARPAGEAAVAG
jgi:hypothetical protein